MRKRGRKAGKPPLSVAQVLTWADAHKSRTGRSPTHTSAGPRRPWNGEAMLDERVCPSCQVILRDGTNVCVKCGRTVAPPKTNIGCIDTPLKVYALLAGRLTPFWAGVIAAALCLALYLLGIFRLLVKFFSAQ
jgi:hypothetical protein